MNLSEESQRVQSIKDFYIKNDAESITLRFLSAVGGLRNDKTPEN
jgi:hypothetical protein